MSVFQTKVKARACPRSFLDISRCRTQDFLAPDWPSGSLHVRDWSLEPAGDHVTLSRPLIRPGDSHSWCQQLPVRPRSIVPETLAREDLLQAMVDQGKHSVHFIALQWSLDLRVICKPLHTLSNISPF